MSISASMSAQMRKHRQSLKRTTRCAADGRPPPFAARAQLNLVHLIAPPAASPITHSSCVVSQYADNTIDAKEFTAIVRDMQMMLKYDANGDGVMDAGELVEALTSLGISCDADLVGRVRACVGLGAQ